jgi:hypothetical protein
MQDAAAGLYLASQIEGLDEAAIGIHNPKDVSTQVLHDVNVCGLLGSVLEGGSSALEMGSNALLAVKNKRLSKDPLTARRGVIERVSRIDALLKEREKLVGQTHGIRSDVYEDETKLLKYFRDRAVFEFSEIYADVKSNQSSSNLYYALDVIGSAGYFASYILGMKSFSNRRYTPASLITAIGADAVFIPAAPIYAWACKKLNARWQARLSIAMNEQFSDTAKQIKEIVPKLDRDAHLLHETHLHIGMSQEIADHKTAKLFDRISAYELWAKRIEAYIEKREILLRQLALVARQSNTSGPPIGAAFLGADIVALNAHYKLRNNEKASSANLFGGLTATTVASLADIAFTTGWFIDDELTHRKLKRLNALPEQLIDDRLRTLDELESILASKKTVP